jgi:tRNA(Ile)-lysidine synthase
VCSGYRIAVAHHANDLAETVLFNLLRGSGIRGGRGILPINGSIIRPLLCVTRKQIEDYLNSEKITYVTDSTNQDCDYTRNKLRNIVIPYLEENINAGAVENLCSFAEILADTQQHLQKEAQLAAKDCREQYGNVIWLKEDVRKLDRAVRGELLRETLAILTSSLKDIANTHVCTVEKMFQLTAGSAADLPYGIKCLRGYQGVYLYPSGTDIYQMPEIAQLELGSIPLECEERIRFLKEPVNENQKIPLNGYTKYFDYDKIKGNLCIRRRMSGDYLILSPDGGRKLLKDYLIERKVPVALRNRIVLVADGSHILWVVGLRDSAGCRIDGNTRWVLKVWLDDGMQDGGNEHE